MLKDEEEDEEEDEKEEKREEEKENGFSKSIPVGNFHLVRVSFRIQHGCLISLVLLCVVVIVGT